MAGSTTGLNADLEYFFGSLLDTKTYQPKHIKQTTDVVQIKSDTNSHRLCEVVDDYGKAAVMALSNFGKLPRFSKYAGALEWRNCVYLWINLGGKSGYTNSFSEQGRHIMWFGGSKMHQGTISCVYDVIYVSSSSILYLLHSKSHLWIYFQLIYFTLFLIIISQNLPS